MSPNVVVGTCIAFLVAISAWNLSQAGEAAHSLSPVEVLRQRLETPKPDDVMVIAHRACWHQAPEDSLPAIQDCIDLGVDMVEIDVQITADNQLVIMHDETVDRTTNGVGHIGDKTLAELKTLYLKEGQGGDRAALTAHKIPTLEEALAVIRGKILVNLDAKGETLFPTLAAVRRLGMTKEVLFKAANLSQHDMAQFKDVYFMPVVREVDGTPLDVSAYQGVRPVAFEIVFVNPGYLQRHAKDITGNGHRLWVNTMWAGLAASYTDASARQDPDAHWGYLVTQGVNMIQTDEPKALLEYLKVKKLR